MNIAVELVPPESALVAVTPEAEAVVAVPPEEEAVVAMPPQPVLIGFRAVWVTASEQWMLNFTRWRRRSWT